MINGKELDLKVSVEDSLENVRKRNNFWKAVRAIKKLLGGEDDLIIDLSTCCIYNKSDHVKLGKADEDGYEWKAEAVTMAFPMVTLSDLRRTSIKADDSD